MNSKQRRPSRSSLVLQQSQQSQQQSQQQQQQQSMQQQHQIIPPEMPRRLPSTNMRASAKTSSPGRSASSQSPPPSERRGGAAILPMPPAFTRTMSSPGRAITAPRAITPPPAIIKSSRGSQQSSQQQVTFHRAALLCLLAITGAYCCFIYSHHEALYSTTALMKTAAVAGGKASASLRKQQQQQQQPKPSRDLSNNGDTEKKAELSTAEAAPASAPASATAALPITPRDQHQQDGSINPSFLDNPEASFGGCLMIMDDNHFLAEWLAYHWYVMPLRHLVVYIDPKSNTSPLPILERYKDKITFEIVDWTYPDAYSEPPEGAKGTIHADPTNRKLVGEQLKYYEDCIKFYKRHNWNSWITLHDTDEFVSINPQARNEKAYTHLPNVPDNTEPGSVMKWLQMTMAHRLKKDGSFTPCLGVPRMQFCTTEAEPTTTYSSKLGLQDKDFLSLRWSTFPKGKIGTRAPKDFVYIGAIEREYIENMDMLKNGARPHEVIPEKCEWHQRREGSPFQIYHYSGTPEQRQFRVDPRGKFGSRPGSPPADKCGKPKDRIHANDIKPWLDAFVKQVGEKEAKRLLQGVGSVKGWPDYTGPIPQTLGIALPE